MWPKPRSSGPTRPGLFLMGDPRFLAIRIIPRTVFKELQSARGPTHTRVIDKERFFLLFRSPGAGLAGFLHVGQEPTELPEVRPLIPSFLQYLSQPFHKDVRLNIPVTTPILLISIQHASYSKSAPMMGVYVAGFVCLSVARCQPVPAISSLGRTNLRLLYSILVQSDLLRLLS